MLPDLAMPRSDEAAHPGRRLAIGVGGLAVLLAAIDAYVVVSIFETILNALGLPINHLERATPIVTGYLLGYVGGMPLLARVSDRFGRRIVIYAGLAGFAAGSALTASADTENLLVIGRFLQGIAGGALLPVTLALAADLFAGRSRPRVLGAVGAAQELGSVVGPLYGAWVASQIGWRWIFWINIPLAVVAALLVHRAVPRRQETDAPRPRVDVIGGLLLAACLAMIVVALDNQHPDVSVLPPHGRLYLGIAAALFAIFIVWEVRARTKLLDMAGVAKRLFFGSMATSLFAGVALLVTLVFIQLYAQSVLDMSAIKAALLLARFLIALPIGALIGGFLVRWLGEYLITVAGLIIAGLGYFLVAHWPQDMLTASHHIGSLRLPVLDTDLGLAGLGLGLVIAPLSTLVLRAVPEESHGIASAALVVARMVGMLVGVSAVAAWGLHRFQELTTGIALPFPATAEKVAAYEAAVKAAARSEYLSIFLIISGSCVIGAVVALATLSNRRADRQVVTTEP